MFSNNKLLSKPTVFVVGKTQFDESGMDEWIKARGFEESEHYPTSPVKILRDGGLLLNEVQDNSEQVAELAGRFCYDSMLKGRPSDEYIANIIEQRHGSVLEHVTYNLAIEGVSRSLSLELIRHRAGFAISQESQRFVDATKIHFVVPPMFMHLWGDDLDCAEARQFRNRRVDDLEEYRELQEYTVAALQSIHDEDMRTIIKKRANEAARSVLPNCAETRLFWSGNLRALRHFCELRGSKHADLEIRRLAVVITETMLDRAPFTFSDFSTVNGDFGVPFTHCFNSKV